MDRHDLNHLLVQSGAILYPGLDDALIGITYVPGRGHLAVYDRERCIRIRMELDGISYDEACDFQSYNIDSVCCGPRTPIFADLVDSAVLDHSAKGSVDG